MQSLIFFLPSIRDKSAQHANWFCVHWNAKGLSFLREPNHKAFQARNVIKIVQYNSCFVKGIAFTV